MGLIHKIMQAGKELVLGAGLAGIVGCSATSEHEIEGYAGATFKNNYVTSGITIVDNSVIQPTVGIIIDGYDINVWENRDLERNETSEIDVSIGKEVSLGEHITTKLTLAQYMFPGTDFADAQNIRGKVTAHPGSFEASLQLDKIFGKDSGKGRNLDIQAGRSIKYGDVALGVNAGALHNDHYFTDERGFSVGYAQVGVGVTLGDWRIATELRRQRPLDRDTFGDTFSSETTYGITIERSFGDGK